MAWRDVEAKPATSIAAGETSILSGGLARTLGLHNWGVEWRNYGILANFYL